MTHVSFLRRPAACLLLVAILLAGCSEQEHAYFEVLREDELIDAADLLQLVRIASRLPDQKLPELPPHFLPPPQWDMTRPVGVSTLAREELDRLRGVHDRQTFVSVLAEDHRLRHILREERLTLDQFVGLVLCAGLALNKHAADPQRDLQRYVDVGRRELARLKTWSASFAGMTPDKQYEAIEMGHWLTRVDRAERLLAVPPENVELVARFHDQIAPVFREPFKTDPLAAIADPLRDHGVPFVETPALGFDSELTWDPKDKHAIVGGNRIAEDAGTALETASRYSSPLD